MGMVAVVRPQESGFKAQPVTLPVTDKGPFADDLFRCQAVFFETIQLSIVFIILEERLLCLSVSYGASAVSQRSQSVFIPALEMKYTPDLSYR